MKTIYKYQLELVNKQVVDCPGPATILSVKIQNDQLWVWVIVDPANVSITTRHKKEFLIVGTGHELPADYREWVFLDSIIDGSFVWHVFYK